VDATKYLRGQLPAAFPWQTNRAQLLEVAIQSLDNLIGIVEKRRCSSVIASSSLAQNDSSRVP
jgi:hypothetical protein